MLSLSDLNSQSFGRCLGLSKFLISANLILTNFAWLPNGTVSFFLNSDAGQHLASFELVA